MDYSTHNAATGQTSVTRDDADEIDEVTRAENIRRNEAYFARDPQMRLNLERAQHNALIKSASECFTRFRKHIVEHGAAMLANMPGGLHTQHQRMPDNAAPDGCRGYMSVRRSATGRHLLVVRYFDVGDLPEKKLANPNKIEPCRMLCSFTIRL